MDFNRLCLWCMHETLENGVCGHCGMRPGWTQDPPYALPAGTILHGRYLVGRVLGHGGFGITYLAEDLQVERTVAVKEYLPNGLCARQAGSTRVESSEEEDFQYGLKSFLEEAQTIYQLQHILMMIFDKNPAARVVCTAVTLETVGEAARRFAPLAEADMVQLSVTRTRKAGRYHLMDAQNPVWIFSGEGKGHDA